MTSIRTLPVLTHPDSPDAGGAAGVDRRAFLVDLARLAAVSTLLGACGDGGTAPNLDGSLEVRLSDYPGLATPGGVARIQGASTPIALVHIAQDLFLAFSLRCPHEGVQLQTGSGEFTCPEHGARFGLDGGWKGGHRTGSLLEFPTTYDPAAGIVTIAPRP